MTRPAWRDDILAVYPYFLDRLREIKSVKKVLEAEEMNQLTGDRKKVPLNGAVYVVLDGFTPNSPNNDGEETCIEIGFSVILTMVNYTPKPNIDGVGTILTAICKALQGFDPKTTKGEDLVFTPFEQKTALPIRYEDGFAYFPLRFTANVAVIVD